MTVVYVPAHIRVPAHVQNHVLVESGTNWDLSRSALVTPIVPVTDVQAESATVGAAVPSAAVNAHRVALALTAGVSSSPEAMIAAQKRPLASPAARGFPLGQPSGQPILKVAVAQPPVAPPAPVWTLKSGETISHGLEAWGQQAHWTVLWKLPKDWAVPATTHYTGSFEKATGEVLRTLSAEGVLLKGEVYEGNHTLLVVPTGERE